MSDEQSMPNASTVEESEEQKTEAREARSARSATSASATGAAEDQPAPVSFKPTSRTAAPKSEGKSKSKSSVPRARRMKLSLTKIDPWSVTKVTFLLSIAGALIQVVAIAFLWALLNSIGLFDNITQIVSSTGLDSGGVDIASLFGIGKVLSITTIFSIFEIVLITVLATIGAFLYNIVSALVGGVHLTLGDD